MASTRHPPCVITSVPHITPYSSSDRALYTPYLIEAKADNRCCLRTSDDNPLRLRAPLLRPDLLIKSVDYHFQKHSFTSIHLLVTIGELFPTDHQGTLHGDI